MAQLNIDFRRLLEYYLQLTKPMHKLRDKEIKLLSAILYLYYSELENFSRVSDTWKKVFDYDSRIQLMEEVSMNTQVFNNYLTALRKKGVIKNNQVVPSYTPLTDHNCDIFELKFVFNINRDVK